MLARSPRGGGSAASSPCRPTAPRRHSPSALAAAVAGLWLLSHAGSSLAQTGTAAVWGTVTDPAGARVPHARVLVVSTLGTVAATETDSLGVYRLEAVTPGRYELRVAAEGFRADPLPLVVQAGVEVQLPVSLRVSAVAESVVVSAAQVELPLARAADSVSVMTARDIADRQLETVADAIRSVPGITVARNGGRGGVTSIFPRGGESDFTLVLVDGVKVNAFGGGFDFSGLSTADVERIEVVRGPESALFGADAIGAVVQVVTRSGGGRPTASASAEAGSFATRRFAANTSGARGSASWGASVERVSSDGFTGRAPATGEEVVNDDYRSTHVSGVGGWRLPWGGDLRGSVNVTSSDRGFPGPFGSNPIGAYTAVDRLSRGDTLTRQFGARWLQAFGGRVRQSASASYADLDNDFAGQYGLSASSSRRLNVRTQTDVDLAAGASLSGGVEAQRERATSTFITADAGRAVPIRRLILGLFGELRVQPASRLSVTAGVRADRIRRDRLEASADPYSPRPIFGVDARTSVNPRLSAAFVLPGSERWGSVKLRATAGTGIRAPDGLEIAFTDNPGLKPERSRSIEGGADWTVLDERAVVGITAFSNRYRDLIVAVGPAMADASRYRTDNISNARSRGVEVSAALRPLGGLSVRAGYTFLSTAILAVDRLGVAPAPFHVGDRLLRRPAHEASLDVAWARNRLVVFGRLGARGRTLDVEPSWGTYGGLFENRGFAVVDLGAGWHATRHVEIIGRVANLLDRRYEETFGFPALGRNVMLGVRVAAGR